MARPRVYVSRRIQDSALWLLREHCDVELYDSECPPPKSVLVKSLEDKDAALILLSDTIDREVLEKAWRLRVVSTMSAGYDHIDLKEATARGVYVTNVPSVLTDAVAEFSLALLFSVARRIVEADRFLRRGSWKIAWSPMFMLGPEISGKTLGIIGLGAIGKAVASRARCLGMRVIYFSRTRKPDVEAELGVSYRPLNDLLKESDFIILSTALTPETFKMIGEPELRSMKPSSYLINISRGAVVDEKALVKALKEGWIAGAALDVFEKEPIDPENPLISMDNVVLTPHMASATFEARRRLAEKAAENILSVLRGQAPPSLLNPEVMRVKPLEMVKML
ncbi:MAG: D-glycerate dehydrogenase [Candidatus Brockarchaeota archaeon]|nr:D-glycerate dehydrogenase [Candidatus Brockarchaeota archaeon]